MSHSVSLFGAMFASSDHGELWSPRAWLQAMLDVEAAVAGAQAEMGVIPQVAANKIASTCRAELFDLAEISCAARKAGNPAIPLIAALTKEVNRHDPKASSYVHYGITSQDIIDTATSLLARQAFSQMERDLAAAEGALVSIVERHAATPMIGRTLLQQAVPTTMGLKAASWIASLDFAHRRLKEAAREAAAVQIGGAVGTLGAVTDGRRLIVSVASRLGLRAAPPWHTMRNRTVDLASALAILCGAIGKIARDVGLLMQSEVGEVYEGREQGRGGSSAMPHKRNPVNSTFILANAFRAPGLAATLMSSMVQEHERGQGGWHAEWETLQQLFCLAAGSAEHLNDLIQGLEIDEGRMAANLSSAQELWASEAVSLALVEGMGRERAQSIVETACRKAISTGETLGSILGKQPDAIALLGEDLGGLLEVDQTLRNVPEIIDMILAEYRAKQTDDEGAQ